MAVVDTVLWLRRLGFGRSLSAQEIIEQIDGYLFPTNELEFARDFLFDDEGNSLLLPLLPGNHPSHFDQEDDEYWNDIEDLYPNLPIWCKGFALDSGDEFDLTQFDAIEIFLCVSEVAKHFLAPIKVKEMTYDEYLRLLGTPDEVSKKDEDTDNYIQLAYSAVSSLSPQFSIAGAYFNRAKVKPDEIGAPLLGVWASQDHYKFDETQFRNFAKRFCEAVMCIMDTTLDYEFIVPSDLPSWDEDTDFLKQIAILDSSLWTNGVFFKRHLLELWEDLPLEKEIYKEIYEEKQKEIQRWIRIFNSETNPSKWSYYFWENPLDAAVWADCGFKPFEAALWNKIGYEPPDALEAISHGWSFSSIAPMVHSEMTITTEGFKLWGNAGNSSSILDAIDRGFPNIQEYQKYKTIGSDYLTIQRFNEFSKEQLSIQELSRAIALEKSWMDIKDAVAWSKLDQPLSDVVEFKLAKQTPLQASKWIACGIPLGTALKWVSLGLSQKDALLWIEHDVDVNLAQWFLDHRIDSPREGKLWLKYIPKKEIPNWKAAEFDPISASDWREIGFGPKTSLEWLAQGIESAKEAGEWLGNKFELKEAVQWLGRSISPENAKKWKDKGIGPDIAQRREQAGIKP
jgi:hypothetical protein